MVNAFDSPPPYAHHGVRVTSRTAERPDVDQLTALDEIFTDLFGFVLRYEISQHDVVDRYRYSYLLPKGKSIDIETFTTLESRIAATDAVVDPSLELVSIDPAQSDLDEMVFLGTPPSEALREAKQKLRDILDD